MMHGQRTHLGDSRHVAVFDVLQLSHHAGVHIFTSVQLL